MAEDFKYQGDELALFQHAKNWKNYFSNQLKPFIHGNILEVGAGIGATTLLLNDGSANSWVLLEPDESMKNELTIKIQSKQLPANCSVWEETIDQLTTKFDSIIYIDVMEHIENDKGELHKAARLLNPGGYILVLSPAFQGLYNPFDRAIGHFRRYDKKSLRALTPASLQLIKLDYYDSVGFFAAAANKLLLRKKYPTQKQVLLWDRWMIPVSKVTDKLFFNSFGKSIVGVWRLTKP